MILSLIAAIGKNNELGKDNTLLWHIPADLKYFRDTTRGHAVIMGRKTFESIGRPLPNRENIVITRDHYWQADGVQVVHSLDEALAVYKDTEQEVFVIGGAQIYAEALPYADKLYITRIDTSVPADTFFPDVDMNIWRETSHEAHEPNEQNPLPYAFVTYEKTP